LYHVPHTSPDAGWRGFWRLAALVAAPAELALIMLVCFIPSDSLDEQMYLFFIGLAWGVAGCAITLILYRWYVRPSLSRWLILRGVTLTAIAAWPASIMVNIALSPISLPMKSESAPAPATWLVMFSLVWLIELALCSLVIGGQRSAAGGR